MRPTLINKANFYGAKFCCFDPETLKFLANVKEYRIRVGYEPREVSFIIGVEHDTLVRVERLQSEFKEFLEQHKENVDTLPQFSLRTLLQLETLYKYEDMEKSLNYRASTKGGYKQCMRELQRRRKKLGLTYHEMADELGCSYKGILNNFTGDRALISLPMLRKIYLYTDELLEIYNQRV